MTQKPAFRELPVYGMLWLEFEMRIRQTLEGIADRPRRWAGTWKQIQSTTQEWAQGIETHHQRALELGRLFLKGENPQSRANPVLDVGEPKSWRRRALSALVSFCAATLLIGGVGGFLLFLFNFCLLLLLVSSGLGLRVHLPDVFQSS